MKGRIFSGVQPTGNLHLGNYLGAIRNWASLQKDFECIYCVVDLHAITIPRTREELNNDTFEVTAGLIASGDDRHHNIICMGAMTRLAERHAETLEMEMNIPMDQMLEWLKFGDVQVTSKADVDPGLRR